MSYGYGIVSMIQLIGTHCIHQHCPFSRWHPPPPSPTLAISEHVLRY